MKVEVPGWNRFYSLMFYDQNLNLRAQVTEEFTPNGYYTYYHWRAIVDNQVTDEGDEMTEELAVAAAEAAMARQCFQMPLF